jgi:hypothetical protein
MKEDVPQFYLTQDIIPDIINKIELWATFSVLNQSKYKMKNFIKSIPYLREISRNLNLSQELPYKSLVDIITDVYYNRFYMTDSPSRYTLTPRLNEFNEFLTENSLILNPFAIISLIKEKGIRNFQYMFGDAISMTDIISMSNSLMKFINLSYIVSSIVDDFTTYISENFNGRYQFQTAYNEAQYYLYCNVYHNDFADFIHLFFTYEIQKDIFDFTNNISFDINEDSLSDVVLSQDINVNIIYDKDLILTDECYICCNAQVNIQLKCMHTLCDHCIDSMIETVKSDRRNCLTCPFCKADIKDMITNIENKVI